MKEGNAGGGVGRVLRGDKQSIKHLHHRRRGVERRQFPASQTERELHWLLGLPSALVSHYKYYTRSGDLPPRRVRTCRRSPKKGGRHTSGMNVLFFQVEVGVGVGGGRDVRLVSELFGLPRRVTAFRSGTCLEAAWRKEAIRGRETSITQTPGGNSTLATVQIHWRRLFCHRVKASVTRSSSSCGRINGGTAE